MFLFFLKLLGKAALTLAFLGAAAGIISASGCGDYLPSDHGHPDVPDPDTPVITQEFTVFYGPDISFTPDSTGTLTLPAEGNVLFEVAGTDDYTVKVVSNINDSTETGSVAYYYLADGRIGLFSNDDYTEQFIKYLSAPNFFYIDCAPGAYDLETLLKAMYATDNITLFVPEGLEHPYKLIVSSAEGEEIVIQLTQSQQ